MMEPHRASRLFGRSGDYGLEDLVSGILTVGAALIAVGGTVVALMVEGP